MSIIKTNPLRMQKGKNVQLALIRRFLILGRIQRYLVANPSFQLLAAVIRIILAQIPRESKMINRGVGTLDLQKIIKSHNLSTLSRPYFPQYLRLKRTTKKAAARIPRLTKFLLIRIRTRYQKMR